MFRAPKYQFLFLSLSVLTLTACGTSQGVEPDKTMAPVPPVAQQGSFVPVNAPLQITPEGTQEDRLARLEQAVASLQKDYDLIMPAFAQLSVTNSRVQALLDEIEAERKGVPVADLPAATPVTTTTVTKVTTSPVSPVTTVESKAVKVAAPKTESKAAVKPDVASSQSSQNTLKAVRLGEHPGKTRIVVDIEGPAKMTPVYDLDNDEKLLVIDLPGVSGQAAASFLPKVTGLVSAMNVTETANGSSLVIQLQERAKILMKEYVKAEGTTPAKLVFDVGPAT